MSQKTLDEYFIDWESTAFGFGYGTGEPHIIPVLKRFFEICPENGGYDCRFLEADLSPVVAWLLINALLSHDTDALEYGTSPRFAWLTPHGRRLKSYLFDKSSDELVEILCRCSENRIVCYPDACNCGPNGYQKGVRCPNPFWKSIP